MSIPAWSCDYKYDLSVRGPGLRCSRSRYFSTGAECSVSSPSTHKSTTVCPFFGTPYRLFLNQEPCCRSVCCLGLRHPCNTRHQTASHCILVERWVTHRVGGKWVIKQNQQLGSTRFARRPIENYHRHVPAVPITAGHVDAFGNI